MIIDAALRRAAERTREDLGPAGTNYPDIRALLAFVESAIAQDETRHQTAIAALEQRIAQLEIRTRPLMLIGSPLPPAPPPGFLYPTTICTGPVT